jgi:GTPase
VIALNKVDTIDEELAAALAGELATASGRKVYPVSGATGEGVEAVLDALIEHIGRLDAEAAEDESDWSPL